MKVRLLLAAICIFTLPMWFSIAPNKATMNPAPFAMVALAGHIGPNGAWCQCGIFDECICDIGERAINNPVSKKSSRNGNALSGAEVSAGLDPGVSVLFITLVLLLVLRMRI